MELTYFLSKKNGNYIVRCAKGLIIGHASLTPKEFEAGVAGALGYFYGDNYLVGFSAGNGGTINIGKTKISKTEEDLPEVWV